MSTNVMLKNKNYYILFRILRMITTNYCNIKIFQRLDQFENFKDSRTDNHKKDDSQSEITNR